VADCGPGGFDQDGLQVGVAVAAFAGAAFAGVVLSAQGRGRGWANGCFEGRYRSWVARSGPVVWRGFALPVSSLPDFGPQLCGSVLVTQLLQVIGQVAGRGQGPRVIVA